ncbi:MAG: histidine kinase [Clostridiales bacterium]|jgi:two-component system sensor histidine kinase YesM|nr:histidine kinase [Clostridiales bacterium]
MKSITHSGIFRRFIILFFCVAIPFLCITLFLTWRAEYSTRKDMTNAMAQKADYFVQGFEAEYERVVSQQQSLILDYDLINLAYRGSRMSRLTWTMSINRLQEKLRTFKNTNEYMRVMSIYMPFMMRVLSSPDGGRYTYNSLLAADLSKLKTMPAHSGVTYVIDGELAVYTINKSGDDVYYVIETVLSGERLISAFKHFAGGSGCFLYNTDGIISLAEDSETARKLSSALSRSPGEESAEVDGKRYMTVKRQLSVADLTFVSMYDESAVTAPTQLYRFWLWVVIVLFFCLTCFYAFMTHKYMNQPVLVLLEHFKRLEGGDMDSRITGTQHDEFGVLFERFNQMVNRLNSVILQSYKQTIYLQRAELKQLQAQINPHFLYNTYFLLHRLIKNDDPLAAAFSKFLGEYFRYITKSSEDMTYLENEDAHARNYANIQALRFEGRIRVEFDSLPTEMSRVPVPQLIMQPILENAYLHGLENLDRDGLLKVKYSMDERAYHIFILNNGGNINPETFSKLVSELSGTSDVKECGGLINIHRRLRLAFGTDSGLKLSTQDEFFVVEMIINKP